MLCPNDHLSGDIMRRFSVFVCGLSLVSVASIVQTGSAGADPAPVVSIASMTPAIASPGTSVEVLGAGFSSVAAENAVTVNGRPMSVTAASSSRLTVTIPPGATSQVTMQLTDSCPTAVLHLISVERTTTNLLNDDASWSASFFSSGSTLRSGNIELGLNAYGGLINAGVGLRRTDVAQGEVLAHGCACEGWGIGNTTAAGSVVGGASTSLVSTGFDFDGTSATSDTELLGGPTGLRIRHRFTPSSHPDLYRVEVDVVNTGFATWHDVHYRRAFDWDVDPTPFQEYVTFGRRPGAADSYVHYTSNDGFADPNPQAALTHLGSEGYFEDAGPTDHGGLIDIALGDIGPDGGRRSFVFYYGVSLSESGALAAIDEVGAQVYSLGQPDVGDSASTGAPITAVFAVDGTDYSMPPIEALTADDVPPRTRKPKSRVRSSKPVEGVLGDAPKQEVKR